MTKKTKILIAVFLPIFALLALVIRFEYQLRTGERWVLGIEAYDPRDLLHGRYLQFQVKMNWKTQETVKNCQSNQQCCVLLEKDPDGSFEPLASVVDCKSYTKESIVRGRRVGGTGFNISLDRFYIPEKHAQSLEKLLQSKPCQIEIAVSKGGRSAIIRDLLIDGKSWRLYLTD